ncbi:MAG TPA: PHP domain-containing protein [Calidithermus sp.]|nr:PHP domain-containing protein [Calidithermus sp.]
MPLLRGNLHAHTTFSDGVLPPGRLVAEYEALGYDFLAITDHDDLIGEAYWRALDRLAPRLLLFRGVELSWAEFPQHIGRVIGDRETLHVLNHPARYRLSVAETVERARRIAEAGLKLDAVEVTDTGLYRPQYDVAEIPLVRVATDDAHKPPHFGRAWIEVDAPRDRDAIIRAIRAGDFRLGFRAGAA